MTEQPLTRIPLSKITVSPLNARPPGDLKEMVESIKTKGVLQPVLVRPKNGGYELVWGKRRFLASSAAQLQDIPAMVRELSDTEAIEEILTENLQRADVHPLDEADGYRLLHEKHKKSVEEIAAKVGKSKGYVYARLKLCALTEKPRKLFLEGKLDASVALYVARIPGAKLQEEATRDVGPTEWNDQGLSARRAQEIIQQKYMLKLADAPFDVKDAKLVPAAGACESCPKRTGNQRELFADVASGDVCTDPACYEKKKEHAWIRQKEQAKASGQTILSEAKVKELYPYYNDYLHGKEYVDVDKPCENDPKGRTYRQVLGDKLPAPALARTKDGDVHELLPKAEAKAALKAAGVKQKKEQRAVERTKSKVEAKTDLAKALREAAWPKIMEALVAKVEAKAADPYPLRLVAKYTAEGAGLERRFGEHPTSNEIDARIDKMTDAQLRGLLLECELESHQWSYTNRGDKTGELATACARYGVDIKKLEAQAKAELEAAKKPPIEGKVHTTIIRGKKPAKAKGKKS